MASDGGRNGAANAGVDFVKNQCRHLADFARHDLDRQSNPRKLAAGRHAREGSERLLRMARNAELDVFKSIARRRCFGYERDFEPPSGHGEILHRFGDTMRELVGGKAAFG